MYTLACGVFLAPMLGSYVRSDYGKALSALRAEVRPDDAVVLNGPWQDLLYQRYGWGLPHGTIIASRVPLDPDESIGWLERLAAAHSRIWVIDSASDAADPNGVVAGWLDSHAYPRPVIPYEKAILRPYLTDFGAPTLREQRLDVHTLDLSFTTVGLDAASLIPGGEARLRIGAVLPPGSPAIGRRAVVDLIAPSGASVWHWDGPLTPRDETLEYRATILLPRSAASGVYTLRMTLYETDALRNPTRIGDAVVLTTITVAAGP
jgi:hypothetical protein